jgi:hypothetical protein
MQSTFRRNIASIFRVEENVSKNQQVSRWHLHLNRLHGVTSQKMILFITTAVKTSNRTSAIMATAIRGHVNFLPVIRVASGSHIIL